MILDGEERVQIPSLPPLQPLDKPIFSLKAIRRQKEQMSLRNAFMVDKTVSLTYCLEKKILGISENEKFDCRFL